MVTKIDQTKIDMMNFAQELIDAKEDPPQAVRTSMEKFGWCILCPECGAHRENYLEAMGRPCHEEHGGN